MASITSIDYTDGRAASILRRLVIADWGLRAF